ncbi:MAG TPA: O-antigen ligase family protein [Solirubrobacteraceae bacterium]
MAKSLPFTAGLTIPEHPPEGGEDARHSSIWLVAGPTVLVLALLVLATAYAGAFKVGQWAPPALFILIVLLTLLLRGGALALPDRWLTVALAGAWGLAGWAALSALWAASPGAALEGAGRLAMYAAILTLPLVAVGDLRALRVAAHGVVGGIVLIALYALGKMLLDGPSIYLAGRLNGPVEYRNATALLFCLAYWPLIVVAATRAHGRAVRAACFGFAEMMLGLAFLTQSRGVVLGLGCGALVVLVLGPDQVRRAWLALLSVVLLAAVSPWLLTPYHAFAGGGGLVHSSDIAVAARALVVLTLAAVAISFLLAVFDAGLRVRSPAMRRVRLGARVALMAAVLLGLVGGLMAVHGNPAHELQVKWRQFKSLQTSSTEATRYTSAGGQRYDLWRVGLNEFHSNPLGGVGESGYQFGYYRQRRSNRNLDDPHGLLFQIAAELGGVGLVLFMLIPIGLLGSVRRWWGLAPLEVRRTCCGLCAAGATFLGQSLVDWMWRIPGLTGLGLLCLGVAAALLARSAQAASLATRSIEGPSARPVDGPAIRRLPVGRLLAACALLVAVALTLSLYLSDFYIRRARDEIGHSPQAQLADARTAAGLDPWSSDPHYLEASAFESLGDRPAARAQLQQARSMEPSSQVPYGLLGDFEARGGRYVTARHYYRRALALDPLDVGLRALAQSGGQPQGS